ncbi:MAG: pilus assembly protein PilO [Gammaproteobacteria bacterium RBG_16_57_12]|nr:MAG: pilus assembly protein PilO [Gammaproteobacteria bacterium RBG_16_57_12]
MKLADFKNLDMDINNIGSWPLVVKMIAIGLVCAALLLAAYLYDVRPGLEVLEAGQNKEKELRATYEAKQAKAAKLAQYQEQIKEIERSFGMLLRQLPSKTEVADLLVEVSTAGITSGLKFELFQPQKEEMREFYAEAPIKIRVSGVYHVFGDFVSKVADLPRIVTLHDFSLAAKGAGKDSPGNLIMDTTAKTYRYLDEDEVAAQKAAQHKAKAKTR